MGACRSDANIARISGDVRELGPNPKLNVPLVNVARVAFKKSVARLLEARSDPNMKTPICFRSSTCLGCISTPQHTMIFWAVLSSEFAFCLPLQMCDWSLLAGAKAAIIYRFLSYIWGVC